VIDGALKRVQEQVLRRPGRRLCTGEQKRSLRAFQVGSAVYRCALRHDQEYTSGPTGVSDMSKERKSNKENKKKAVLTPKEKKAAKKAKGDVKAGLGIDRTR